MIIQDTTAEEATAPTVGMTWCPECLRLEGLLALGAHVTEWPAEHRDMATSILLRYPLSTEDPSLDPDEYTDPCFAHVGNPDAARAAAKAIDTLDSETWDFMWGRLIGLILALQDQDAPSAQQATIFLRQALAAWEMAMIAGFDSASGALRPAEAPTAAPSGTDESR